MVCEVIAQTVGIVFGAGSELVFDTAHYVDLGEGYGEGLVVGIFLMAELAYSEVYLSYGFDRHKLVDMLVKFDDFFFGPALVFDDECGYSIFGVGMNVDSIGHLILCLFSSDMILYISQEHGCS